MKAEAKLPCLPECGRRWVACLYAQAPSARRLLAAAGNYTPEIEWIGGGRLYLDLTPSVRLLGHPFSLLTRLGRELAREGVPVRAALSSGRFLSRAASGLAELGWLFWLLPRGEGDFLAGLKLESWPGLRSSEISAFRELGVERAGDLARLDLFWLGRLLGRRGVALGWQARGFDPRPVTRRLPAGDDPPFPGLLFPPSLRSEKLVLLARVASSLRRRYGPRVFPRLVAP